MTLRPLYTLNQQHIYKEPSLNTDGADRRAPCVMGRNATRDRLQHIDGCIKTVSFMHP